MYLTRNRSLLPVAVLAVVGIAGAAGQTQDNSGNGLLNGTFHFRHLAVQNLDGDFNPSQTTASFGTIVFDGNGNYTITGTSVDNTVSAGSPQALSVTGSYAIGSNGTGYVANPLYPTDINKFVYGAVSQGVFAGSSTESSQENAILCDIFVAIAGGNTPTNASFTTPYQTGLIDFTNGVATAVNNALFELTPNGKGGLGTIFLNGQASNAFTSTVTQSINGASYNFNRSKSVV